VTRSSWCARALWLLAAANAVAAGEDSSAASPALARRPQTLVYGGSSDFPPYEYVDARGQPSGFDIDLIRALAAGSGWTVEVRLGPWEGVLEDLDGGRIDIASIYRTPDRDLKYVFLGRVWSSRLSLAFPGDRPTHPRRLEDLAGEVVAVRSHTAPERILMALPEARRPSLLRCVTLDQALRLMAAGRANAVLGPELPLTMGAGKLALPIDVVPIQNLPLYFVARKAEAEKFAWLTSTLSGMQQDGRFDRLVEHALVSPAHVSVWWRWGGVAAGLLLAGSLVSLAWTRSLKAQVEARTREMAEAAQASSRAEEALRASERLLRQTSHSTPDLVMVRDMHGALLYVNPAIQVLTGYTADDLRHGFVDWFHPEDAERMTALYRSLYQGGRAVGELFRLVTRDGAMKWISASWGPLLDDAGRQVGVFGVDRDVTDWKRAEDERRTLEAGLLHAQRLESLGILAGGVAHEFNNLLAIILGRAGMAKRALTADARERGGLEKIEAAAERAARLTKQMLAYAGRGPVSTEPVDLAALVGEMAPLLETITPKQARLITELEPGLPPITADRDQIRQLVLALVSNAAEALTNGGQITLRVAAERLDRPTADLTAGAYVGVEVVDNGCGMDEATRSRVFDPFFTTKFPGRGLGLAAVLGIVKSHGGSIEVESQPHAGSRFQVRLPVGLTRQLERHPPAPGEGTADA